MATEKQIAANRANAKRSTGPKTAAGKQRSSRNAYRHGLSRPVVPDPSPAAQPDEIDAPIGIDPATEDRLAAAEELAAAQAQLFRIRTIRAEQWAKVNPIGNMDRATKDLRRLAALDRYERYETTKRRRASRRLDS